MGSRLYVWNKARIRGVKTLRLTHSKNRPRSSSWQGNLSHGVCFGGGWWNIGGLSSKGSYSNWTVLCDLVLAVSGQYRLHVKIIVSLVRKCRFAYVAHAHTHRPTHTHTHRMENAYQMSLCRLVREMVERGQAAAVRGNHEESILRELWALNDKEDYCLPDRSVHNWLIILGKIVDGQCVFLSQNSWQFHGKRVCVHVWHEIGWNCRSVFV